MDGNERIRMIVNSERKAQGKTLAQLAKEAGVGLSSVANFTEGSANTSVETAEKVLNALGLELSARRKKKGGGTEDG